MFVIGKDRLGRHPKWRTTPTLRILLNTTCFRILLDFALFNLVHQAALVYNAVGLRDLLSLRLSRRHGKLLFEVEQ